LLLKIIGAGAKIDGEEKRRGEKKFSMSIQ